MSINYARNTTKFHRQKLREQLAKINHFRVALMSFTVYLLEGCDQ